MIIIINENNEYLVSIVCMVYNHEKYLRRALDSFVMQKTTFPFIALVHDDCSTDSSADIIREYEEKYPDIIKGIYEKENQYSKGSYALTTSVACHIHSKYVAICEGDDFWTDENKLQKQFELMEKNPDHHICAHSVKLVNDDGETTGMVEPSKHDTIFTVDEVIKGGGGFVCTSSLFMTSSVYTVIPDFCKDLLIDYAIQIYGSLDKGMLYLKDCMSAYTVLSQNSFTAKMSENKLKSGMHTNNVISMLFKFNNYTNLKYNLAIIEHISDIFEQQLYSCGNYYEVHKLKSFKLLSLKKRIKLLIKTILRK